jgi:hypothetical protein
VILSGFLHHVLAASLLSQWSLIGLLLFRLHGLLSPRIEWPIELLLMSSCLRFIW